LIWRGGEREGRKGEKLEAQRTNHKMKWMRDEMMDESIA
jgi:hypothetical protein